MARGTRFFAIGLSDERWGEIGCVVVVASPDHDVTERDVLALCKALGYDLNTVEFALRDGVPYAIDFMNPAPDADYWTVGQENYEWVIRTMGAFLAEKARKPRRTKPFTAHGVLE